MKNEKHQLYWVMIKLSWILFDNFSMDSKIASGEFGLQVPQVYEKVDNDHSKCTVQFGSQLGGCHVVDWDCTHGGTVNWIEYESIFCFVLDKIVFRHEECVQNELQESRWKEDGKVVMFFHVHGFCDIVHFLVH